MNAVFAAVLLAVVATCSGTQVYSSLGGSQLYYSPSAVQYVQPSLQYQQQYQYVQQPIVSSSSLVSSPLTYASSSVIPSTSYLGVQQYPYAYNYGYGLLKK